jgi:hypothetical protein
MVLISQSCFRLFCLHTTYVYIDVDTHALNVLAMYLHTTNRCFHLVSLVKYR